MKRTFGTVLSILALLLSARQLTAQEPSRETVKLRLVGANPAARPMPLTNLPEPSYFFLRDRVTHTPEEISSLAHAWYRDVYPGIDLICYDDGYDMEYVFVLAPGADPSIIGLSVDGPQNFSITQTGSILMQVKSGEIIQSQPVVFEIVGDARRQIDGIYNIGSGGVISINVPGYLATQMTRLNGMRFNLVSGGGQPGGPAYNFFMSKFETTNEQYRRFLNNAQGNLKDARGSFMVFDRRGNVWINPERRHERDELFSIENSRLVYDPAQPAGARYDHQRKPDTSTPFATHPVSGVSWYGAVKYCDWLTILSGRTAAECCYREGTNGLDWAPVTATNWVHGTFSESERELWLLSKGFRLPMVNCDASLITTNRFNEFYKAGASYVFTNRLYGFGRDVFDGTDANCRETIGRKNLTSMPVGFFNGDAMLGKIRTRANANIYSLFDLTGNADEWINDFGVPGDPTARILGGGAWNRPLKPLSVSATTAPHSTSIVTGFRPVTTYMPSETVVIHILFSFYMEPEGAITGAVKEAGVLAEEIPPEEPGMGTELDVTPNGQKITGIAYQTTPTEEAIIVPTQPEGGGEEGTTPHGPVTLDVNSLTPNAGVFILVSPADTNGLGTGMTPLPTHLYEYGTLVHLTAPSSAGGNRFVRWLRNGVFYSANRSIDVVMNDNITMTAVFESPRTLTVESITPDSGVGIAVTADRNGNGNGSTTFNRIYNDGATVTLTAPTVAGGNDFIRWLRNGVPYSTNPSVTITMDSDITMTAVFLPTRTLIVQSSNPNSGVAITDSPLDNNGNGDGVTTFTRIYYDGTLVTLRAPPNAGGNRFVKWQRNGIDYSPLRLTTVLMDADYTMMAIFVYVPDVIPDPDASNGGI